MEAKRDTKDNTVNRVRAFIVRDPGTEGCYGDGLASLPAKQVGWEADHGRADQQFLAGRHCRSFCCGRVLAVPVSDELPDFEQLRLVQPSAEIVGASLPQLRVAL